MRKISILMFSLLTVILFSSCGENMETKLYRINSSSGSPFAKETAIAIVYSKYNMSLPEEYAGTIYYDVYNLLEEYNFWKDSYKKISSKLDSSSYQTLDEEIVFAVLNYKFGRTLDCSPAVQDVIDVLIECKIK